MLVHIVKISNFDIITKYSTLKKLQRVVAYCFLFITNCKLKKSQRRTTLAASDLQQSLVFCVKHVQQEVFSQVIAALRDNKPVGKQFESLCPFLDSGGILRVGGRLDNANMPYTQKHPMLIPQKHHLTTLIIRHEHERLLYAGAQLTMAAVLNSFWIVNAKKPIRKCIYACIKCFRHRATTADQMMSSLPASRVQPARAFLKCGVDFGGPFILKSLAGRGGKTYKAYIAFFVCFSTKAIHIELVTGLGTDVFLASLRRFVSRRGKPSDIYSDNGRNFIGANNELKILYDQFQTQQHNQTITDALSKEGVNWSFIPPQAPHQGGIWEAGIKSAKIHMKKIIGDTILTYEEMSTCLHQIEACLNSRPITPASTDPNDLQALTPGHFLIGEPLMAIPEPDLTQLNVNTITRFQMIQQMSQHFWKRWRHEYLNTLQQRTKWTNQQPNLEVGDVVLVKEDNAPALHWKRARVIQTHMGKDNNVRVVTIK